MKVKAGKVEGKKRRGGGQFDCPFVTCFAEDMRVGGKIQRGWVTGFLAANQTFCRTKEEGEVSHVGLELTDR